MDKIIPFDYLLTNLFSKIIPHNIFFDYFFSFFSLKGSSIFIWILVIALVIILEEKKNPGLNIRDKKFIFLFSISFLLTAFLTDIILKNIFMRSRPFPLLPTPYNLQPFLCPLDFSFPSAHAATAFAAAGVLTYFDKKRSWFYYSVAIFISYSRIYMGCHYFFDVVAGASLGYLISKFTLKLFPNP
ncbi:MAG: Phosphoesterase PA-phosphatase related protein [Candidatus Levybacteria bacterium GW2011_GWA2_37_36]|uniref:Phosphoesterase PA-phosphatase related protein n=1 Tax=Candidatus Roizmanbacteria bacterium GW2011_GWC2_34_23 TaxID=1618484 RepID=A0A0G0B074_9BACT|nr:MAG: Phosphoesterase PA-phosphatase related protein [Candidatus Roizmanbacteria bacterium GW2011_GWC2_34_23]KKQ32777.1 MAG: Phosphoesterase PA-phosphatase related protein [Candidatus Levybacteria bacterium GW2011_GWA2_37_36]